ncbi:MAG: methyltransferase domain-containing protein [Pseudodesulfovibrio sp.]
MDEYERIAPHYDRTVGAFLRPVHRAVLDALPGPGPLLDLCCGTGLLTGLAATQGRAALGVDLSPAMLTRARHTNPGVRFILADGASLPFAAATFAAVAVCFALHEKPAPTARAMLAEARRVTAPGGALLVADYRAPRGAEPLARLTGLGVAVVERLAGRNHFAHYHAFRRSGGSRALLESAGLEPDRTGLFLGGTVGIYRAEV